MLVRHDFAFYGRQGGRVTLTMPLSEFREHVEWLENVASLDGCTRDWRAELDRIDPPEQDSSDSVRSTG